MPFYPHVKFLTSAAEAHQLAPDMGREIAFAGRSNAGKSTAINAITQRAGARAREPHAGPHPADQFFRAGAERRLVDLPGYGFAKVPEKVRARWLELMEHYFNVRESLVGLVLIVDSRRGLGAQDAAMLEWVLARDRQAHVLLTKADKLNRRDALRVLTGDASGLQRHGGHRAIVLRACQARPRRGARSVMDRWLADGSMKKRPRWTL